MTEPVIDLYNQFLAQTGEPNVAATLTLAQVVAHHGGASQVAPSVGEALIGLNDAARLLGYKPAGLRKLAKQGLILYVQNGRGPIRFKRQWVDDYIASNNPQGVKRSPVQRRKPISAATGGIDAAALGFKPSLYRKPRAA